VGIPGIPIAFHLPPHAETENRAIPRS
jgi:hypothetical protein